MKYVANPVEVEAFWIAEVGSVNHISQTIALVLENGERVLATKEMTARYLPQVGDYWVVQSDGYTYLNPKAVFERKYSQKNETRELVHNFIVARDALVMHICKQFDQNISKAILSDLAASTAV